MLIAPLIPFWGIVSFFGAEQLWGTRYMVPFVIVMALFFVLGFVYVLSRALQARRTGSAR